MSKEMSIGEQDPGGHTALEVTPPKDTDREEAEPPAENPRQIKVGYQGDQRSPPLRPRQERRYMELLRLSWELGRVLALQAVRHCEAFCRTLLYRNS